MLETTTSASPDPTTPNLDSYEVIRNAVDRYGHDGKKHIDERRQHNDDKFWRDYLGECSKTGRSPYQMSRHNRRAAIAMVRHDGNKLRARFNRALARFNKVLAKLADTSDMNVMPAEATMQAA